MRAPYKLAIILLLVALVFSVASFVIVNYFPELRGQSQSGAGGGSSGGQSGNIRIEIMPPADSTPGP
jgi:hypothetical protein